MMKATTKRTVPVKVEWNFLPKPEQPKMMILKNGQRIRAGVQHGPHAEDIPIARVFCYGCVEYFKSYHHYLWRHGLCQQPPGGKMPYVSVQKKPLPSKKNDKTPFPRGWQLWSKSMLETWIRQHRPEMFEKLFGRKP